MVDLAHLRHLVGRFVESCRPGAPGAEDLAWVTTQLSEAELALWNRMNNPDKRHSVGVARAVAAALPTADAWVMSAALLHDVGKVVCGYRTPARVVATLVWSVVPSEKAESWRLGGRPLRKLGEYHLHPALGAELCADAGSHEYTAQWAAQHHLRPGEWTVPAADGEILKDCDDD